MTRYACAIVIPFAALGCIAWGVYELLPFGAVPLVVGGLVWLDFCLDTVVTAWVAGKQRRKDTT